MNLLMVEFNWENNLDNFKSGLLPALISIAVVFVILILIMFIVMIVNKVNIKPSKKENGTVAQAVPTPTKKAITMEDIKDEDMMVAVLVATIDYRNQTKKDVRLVDVKQIG